MDEKKIAKYLLISLISMMAFAWILTVFSMNQNIDDDMSYKTKDIACFSA